MARERCSIGRVMEALEREGVPSRLVEPGRPSLGEKWWPFPLDAWPLLNLALYRGATRPGAILVASPGSPEGVAAVLRVARLYGACVVPRGGGSGVLGATYRGGCCVVLDLSHLDNVEVNTGDLLARAGAGATLARVEEEARRHGLTIALEPQSVRHATVGGFISTLGSGAITPGVGNVEDALIALTLALPNGKLVRLGSPRRPRGLLLGVEHLPLGAEGAFGVVVEAWLRLRPVPEYMEGFAARFDSVSSALAYAGRLASWNPPLYLRVLDERESMLLYGLDGVNVIVAYADDKSPRVPEALAREARRLAESMSAELRGDDLLQRWHRERYSYGERVRELAGAGLWFDTIDTQATLSRLPRVHEAVHRALDSVEGVIASFSHISHFYPGGASLYTTIITVQDPQVLEKAWEAALEAALRTGGSITHHHGLGLQKLPWARRELEGELELFCTIKKALDPEGVLRAGGAGRLCRGT